MRLKASVGIAAMMAALLGAAQAPAADQVTARNSVSFISGGVGVDSEERLKAREREFNLKLVMTLVEGNYLADVGVKIVDGAGKTVIEHVTEGPIFLAKLPGGTYAVSATYEGTTQSRKVKVGERLRTEYFRWKKNPETDFALSPEQRRE